MSLLGFYFVDKLLREMGWPRKQGLFRAATYDSTIVDSTIDQMVNWAAALGAGRPTIALQIIAEMFRDRDWNGLGAPQIDVFVASSRAGWDSQPQATVRDIVQPARIAETFGAHISPKHLQDSKLRTGLEQIMLASLLWGLANPARFAVSYANDVERFEASRAFTRGVGLDIEPLPPIDEWFQNAESIVRDYERDVAPLPAVPTKLLSDAKALGIEL